MKKTKKILICIMAIISVLFIIVEFSIYTNLRAYGYGLSELPKTTLVYLRISKGFTVSTDERCSTFIGRHSYIYDDLFKEKGYYEYDQMGMDYFYRKDDKVYSSDNRYEFCVMLTDDWCHWFRVYKIDADYKIENF